MTLKALAAAVGAAMALLVATPPVAAEGEASEASPATEGLRYHGSDPERDPQPYNPFSAVDHDHPAEDARSRGIRLTPAGLELVQGGRLVGEVAFDASVPVAFEAVVRALADKAWIDDLGAGVFGLRAAFVQAPGTVVRFVAPGTRELRLASDPPGVFIGGTGHSAAARFEGVKVTSWDLARRAPSEDVDAPRPFVLFQDGARLDIAHSEMAYLGSDRVGAYGVSWKDEGATGEVTDSVFHHGFFGVYSNEARDLVFRRNVFRDNLFYGLDPHTGTTGVVAEANEAYSNGTHGFIFSADVTGGTLRGNYAHDNGGNGIVMDRRSDRNLITGNRIEGNALDGIVLQRSSDNVVEDNFVSGHRTAIRANQPGARNVIRRNRVTGNEVGIEAHGGASDLTITDNEVLDSSRIGMIIEAPRCVVRGGRVIGGTRGIDLRSVATVSGVEVDEVDEAVLVRHGATAEMSRAQLRAHRVGIRVERGGATTLGRSTIEARIPTRGTVRFSAGNHVRSPRVPVSWLAMAGLVAVNCAVALECLQIMRERRARAPEAWSPV